MNYSTHRFTLDLQKHQSQISIAAFQYDTAKKLSIGLTDGGVPYYLEDGCIAVLCGKKANGEPIVHTCSIEGNTRVIYEFNKETASDVGIINCQIHFYKDGSEILAAPRFIIVVAERQVNDSDIFDSEDETFTHEQLSALDDLFVSESARVMAEAGRVEAETLRDTAEKERIAAEIARQEAETKREEQYSQIDTRLENKVDKTALSHRLYGTMSSGVQTVFSRGTSVKPQFMVQRDANSDVLVNETPIAENGATSKKYVDKSKNEAITHANSINQALAERVSEVESLTLSYTEDSTEAYEKAVPAEVGKYALIKSIGGATEKVTSTNIFDPTLLSLSIFGGASGTENVPITVNADGSISFTVYYADGLGAYGSIGSTELSAGKYYYIIEGADYVFNNVDSLSLEFHLPFGEEYGEQGYADENTFNVKIMIWKYEDSDTIEFAESAPEGSEFEPYSGSFINAEVTKIESIGANLFGGEVFKEALGAVKNAEVDEANKTVSVTGANLGGNIFYSDFKADTQYTFFITGLRSFISDGVDANVSNLCIKYSDGVVEQIKFVDGYTKGSAILVSKAGKTVISFQGQFYGDKSTFYYDECGIMEGVWTLADYKPYHTSPIDSMEIPEAVRALEGYGMGFIDDHDRKFKNSVLFNDDDIYFSRAVFERTYDGSEAWATHSTKSHTYMFNINFRMANGITKEYNPISADEIGVLTGTYMYESNLIYVTDFRFSTLEEFKAHLAEKPLKTFYSIKEPTVTNITDLFTEDNSIEVEGGGRLRFVNENEMSVPNTIAYVTRKE